MRYAFLDIELADPLPGLTLAADEQGLGLLVRRHGLPLCFDVRSLPPGSALDAAALAQLVADRARVDLVAAAVADELAPPRPTAPAPVELAVHVRRRWGGQAVRAALAGSTAEYVALLGAGTVLDDGWRDGVADALARHPDAAAVTGPALPAPLRSHARVALARRGGGHRSLEEVRRQGSAADPLTLRGAGFQVVVRRAAALAAGPVDSPRRLVESLLADGHAVVHAPRVLAFHPHADLRVPARLARLAARRPRGASDTFAPSDVLHVDLAEPLPARAARRAAFVVLWWRDVPLGQLVLAAEEIARLPSLVPRIAAAIAPAVGARTFPTGYGALAPTRYPPPAEPPPRLTDLLALAAPLAGLPVEEDPPGESTASTSVVVCTRNRPDDLARCLSSLAALERPPAEIVVVDNDPGNGATAAVAAAHERVVLVPEPRPGLSAARNAGVRAAEGDVIAFVDDDVTVDSRWLERLLRGFTLPHVLSVTGAVLPAELETRAQAVFEATMGSSGRGYRPIRFDRVFFDPQRRLGVPVWAIGAGANMALRREAFVQVGLYDERLGAGAAGCSEDSELWYRLLARGWECRYVPDSVVAHRHRRDMEELRRQTHDYLRGHVASLYVQFARHGHPGNLRRAFTTVPAHLARRAFDELLAAPDARTGTLGAEVTGYLAGLKAWRLALGPRAGSRFAGVLRRAAGRSPRAPAAAHGRPAEGAGRGR